MSGPNAIRTVYKTHSSLFPPIMQIWKIAEYCLKVPRYVVLPITAPPLHGPVWKAHTSSVVSIDGSWKKGILVTASTDLSVRLWNTEGRYIGMQTLMETNCYGDHPITPS